MPDAIVSNALGAGLLGDTAAFQHHLVRGAEAAFRGVVRAGARVALTLPGAATLTVVVDQGGRAGHSCREQRGRFSGPTATRGEQVLLIQGG